MSGNRARWWVWLAVFAALSAALSVWPPPAGAHDHRIPKVKIVSTKAWQRGKLQSFCWATGQQGTNVACAGGAYSWPNRDRTPSGEPARIRIDKSQRPRKLKIRRWRRLDEHNAPVGDGRLVDYNLVRIVRKERIMWEARFQLPDRRRHFYVKAKGMWRDVESGARQNAVWTFHLKLR